MLSVNFSMTYIIDIDHDLHHIFECMTYFDVVTMSRNIVMDVKVLIEELFCVLIVIKHFDKLSIIC